MTAVLIEAQPPEAKRVRRWPWAIVVVAAGILLAGGVLGSRWYSGLSLLMPYPAGAVSGPVTVGHTVYADTGLYAQPTTGEDGVDKTPDSIPITISAITPHVDSNTSQATLHVLVCHRNGSTTAVGTQESGLSFSCSTVIPFTSPMTIDLGFSATQVLVAVTPQRPGVVHIAGIDVTYAQGPRHTTQRAGADLTFTSK